MATRGERNNNPGNIRQSSTIWQGQADDQSSDASFVVFKSPHFGLRALAKILINYQLVHKLYTIKDIINRWAPTNENNTDAYVNDVANRVGVSPTETVNLQLPGILNKLVIAIIFHENGSNSYPQTLIDNAVQDVLP